MTHIEAQDLLPLYAVNALDGPESDAFMAHLATCEACAAELANLEPATSALAGATTQLQPPSRLRQRVLSQIPSPAARSNSPSPAAARENLRHAFAPTPRWLLAAVLVVALAGGTAVGFLRDARARAELSQDQAALALLTSTETASDRLAPNAAAGLPADAHGHWFHQAGTPTQVIVAEFLPAAEPNTTYVAWQRVAGTWRRAGKLDDHSRLILQGSDGRDVTAIEITRETSNTDQPAGTVLLRFPA